MSQELQCRSAVGWSFKIPALLVGVVLVASQAKGRDRSGVTRSVRPTEPLGRRMARRACTPDEDDPVGAGPVAGSARGDRAVRVDSRVS